MAAFIRPIDWVRQTLNLWRCHVSENQAMTSFAQCDRADDATTEDVHHELNTQLWYLPPPC